MVHKLKQDKRAVRTRTWLLETLLELIEEKEYADINITELTQKAGIARQTFYRNYGSKDDIILSKMDEILDQYLYTAQKHLESKRDSNWDFEVKAMIYVWKQNGALFKAVHKAGLAHQALEKLAALFSRFHMKAQNLKELDERHQYLVYYLAGGVYMVLNKWFEDESPPPMALVRDLFKKAAQNTDQIAQEYREGQNMTKSV